MISFVVGLIIAIITYFGLSEGAKVELTYSTIGACVLGAACANLFYVIITESFCTSGPCDSTGPCICEACLPCLRAKVYSDSDDF